MLAHNIRNNITNGNGSMLPFWFMRVATQIVIHRPITACHFAGIPVKNKGKKQRDTSLINEPCVRQGLDTQLLTTRGMPSRAEQLGRQGLATVFMPSPSSCRLWHLQEHLALCDDVTGLLHGRFPIHFHVRIFIFDEAILHGHFLRKACILGIVDPAMSEAV